VELPRAILLVSFGRDGAHRDLRAFPTRRSSDLWRRRGRAPRRPTGTPSWCARPRRRTPPPERRTGPHLGLPRPLRPPPPVPRRRSEEHTSELQSRENLVCRLLLEKKKTRVRSSG